jgi:hypothetical protein
VGDGRVIGAVVGVGLVAGLGALLWSQRASAATTRSPRERRVLPASPSRFPLLVERWRGEVAKRVEGTDLPVDAILEWIRIESGGDMCSVGNPTEVGIFQLFFPSDAKYGATLEGLRVLCEKSKRQDPADISWMSVADLDMQVGSGINKILAARDRVRQVFAQNGVSWPESSFDFGSAVKQIHATPAVITELLSKITRRDGSPPSSWSDLRKKVMTFPPDQMGAGLRKLWNAPSKRGLKNRLEDTLQNAEHVGRVWSSAGRTAVVGRDVVAFGISDGRGYGPYDKGYVRDDRGRHFPLGPDGHPLPLEYDFQPGPDGSYMPLRRPLRWLPHLGTNPGPELFGVCP